MRRWWWGGGGRGLWGEVGRGRGFTSQGKTDQRHIAQRVAVISVSHLIPVMTLSGFPAMVPIKHVHCHLQPLSSDDRQEARAAPARPL